MIEIIYNCSDCKRLFSENHFDENHTDPGVCPLCRSSSGNVRRFRDSLAIKPESRNGSQTFYSLLEEAANVHNSKSHDYASNSDPLGNYRFAGELSKLFNDPTDAGLIGRFGEKLYRLANLEKKKVEPLNEAVEDTEIDILVIIGLFVANRRDRRNEQKPRGT